MFFDSVSPKALDLVSKLVSVVCSVNAETAPGASGLEELIREILACDNYRLGVHTVLTRGSVWITVVRVTVITIFLCEVFGFIFFRFSSVS